MKTKQTKTIVTVLALAGLLTFSLLAVGGDLYPSSPPGPTMHSLEDIYNAVSGSEPFVPSVDRGPSDMFIKFDDVEGECRHEGYGGWSDIVFFSQGFCTL